MKDQNQLAANNMDVMSAAKTYAQHGFSVIPIDRNSKRPLIKFADKPPLSPDEVENVWHKHPLANVALKTDRFFVVDVDRHGEEDGTKSIKALNHPEWFTDTLCEKTAHDGLHYFFLKPKNYTIKQSIGFLPGVDIKAHKNNYVVVAPSIIGDKQYQWVNSKPMITVPKGLLKLIQQKQEVNNSWGSFSYVVNRTSQTAKLFNTIANGLGNKGQRDNTLAKFVGGLLFRDVPIRTISILVQIANDNTPDPLPRKELQNTFKSIVHREVSKRDVND